MFLGWIRKIYQSHATKWDDNQNDRFLMSYLDPNQKNKRYYLKEIIPNYPNDLKLFIMTTSHYYLKNKMIVVESDSTS